MSCRPPAMWGGWLSASGSGAVGAGARGSLRLALIGGEAGVGKTRLSTHLALKAHGEGATVLYGRCDEDLGVPYQPWVQALGHLVKEAPQPVLDAHVERFGGELARLVPDLGRSCARPARSARQSDPETERYLLYAAVAGLLEGAGEQEPLLLILDDLHWADSPTLSLLRHVVTAGSSMRVMVVGTYRDSDLSRDHPLTALLADLHREQGVERVKLTGLEAEDVLALMEAAAGHELDEDGRALAAEITRETAGNPFFAGEVLRHLTESGAIVQEDGGRWRLVGDVARAGPAPERARGHRPAGGAPRPRRPHGAERRRGHRPRLRPRSAAGGGRALRGRGCSTCSMRRSRRRCCRRARSGRGASRSPMRWSSTRCMRISGVLAAPGFTSGSRRRWRSSAGMSPASGWASSPATGPRRSSAPTPPRRSTTPGGRRSTRWSSSPRMRRRAGIARRSSSTTRRPAGIAQSAASC